MQKELSTEKQLYTGHKGIDHEFNSNIALKRLMVSLLKFLKRNKMNTKMNFDENLNTQTSVISTLRNKLGIPSGLTKKISIAAYLIYISMLLEVFHLLFFDSGKIMVSVISVDNLLVDFISVLILGILGYIIHLGKQWARDVFVVIVIFAVIQLPFVLIFNSSYSLPNILIYGVEVGLQLFATILLLHKDVREWYNSKKIIFTEFILS